MPGLLRVSLAMYNTAQEVDTLVAALQDIACRAQAGVMAAGS